MNRRELAAARLLAQSLLGAGKYAAALEILHGLAETDADDAFTRRNRVYALLRLGDYEAAEPLARELAETAVGVQRAPALFFHAHALWGCGRLDECREVVERYSRQLAAAAGAEPSEPV